MTLTETCSRLQDYLQKWYDARKSQKLHKNIISGHLTNEIHQNEISEVKNQFMSENPECKEHEFNIYYDFIAVDNSYQPACLDGCCDTRVRVKGVRAEPINWEHMRNCAFKPLQKMG